MWTDYGVLDWWSNSARGCLVHQKWPLNEYVCCCLRYAWFLSHLGYFLILFRTTVARLLHKIIISTEQHSALHKWLNGPFVFHCLLCFKPLVGPLPLACISYSLCLGFIEVFMTEWCWVHNLPHREHQLCLLRKTVLVNLNSVRHNNPNTPIDSVA